MARQRIGVRARARRLDSRGRRYGNGDDGPRARVRRQARARWARIMPPRLVTVSLVKMSGRILPVHFPRVHAFSLMLSPRDV